MTATAITTLNNARLAAACQQLANEQPAFAAVIEQWGIPPLWDREPGFLTLVHIILEQQVSLASAKAAFDRLQALADPVTPAYFLTLNDDTLRQVGFSRQKTRYCRLMAEAIETGALDLAGFARLPDQVVFMQLTNLIGIGPWTANIYLLMVLCRPDIWPVGDVALATAAQEVFDLVERPSQDALRDMSQAWQPWRSAAARILWHHYLCVRGK